MPSSTRTTDATYPRVLTKMGLVSIGFHVPTIPTGRVITRLGRQNDLILRGRTVSAVHVAFEVHPVTHVVVLSVRSKHGSGVTVAQTKIGSGEQVSGDCVITYGEKYDIEIAFHKFHLVWLWVEGCEEVMTQTLKDITMKEYQASLQRTRDVNSRYLPTEMDESEYRSWHMTRIHSAKALAIHEVEKFRVRIGNGSFGTDFRSVDRASGHAIAVKVIKLASGRDGEITRASLHREIKALERYKHTNIIEYLGLDGWETDTIKVFMPLRDGSLSALAESNVCTHDILCQGVLFQMCFALFIFSALGSALRAPPWTCSIVDDGSPACGPSTNSGRCCGSCGISGLS